MHLHLHTEVKMNSERSACLNMRLLSTTEGLLALYSSQMLIHGFIISPGLSFFDRFLHPNLQAYDAQVRRTHVATHLLPVLIAQ